MMASCVPYNGFSGNKTTAYFDRGEFPDVGKFGCGRNISGCWTRRFNSIQEVVVSLSVKNVGEWSRIFNA
jgi:hypothetical protein